MKAPGCSQTDDDVSATGFGTSRPRRTRFAALSTLSYLTDQQQLEETALKKRKLALKDRIEAVLRQHHATGPVVGATPLTRARARGRSRLRAPAPVTCLPCSRDALIRAALPFVVIAAVPSAVARRGRAPVAAALAARPADRHRAVLPRSGRGRRRADPALVLSPADGTVMHAGPARAGRSARRASGSRSRSSCPCSTCTSIGRRWPAA